MTRPRWRWSIFSAVLTGLALATVALAAGSQRTALQPRSVLKPVSTTSSKTTKDVGRARVGAPTKNGLASLIVKLDFASAASYNGGVSDYAPTNTRGQAFNPSAPAVQAYLGYVRQRVQSFQSAVQSTVPQAQITAVYDLVYGGVAMVAPADRIADIARLKGVVSVQRDQLLHLDTDHSPEFIGAPSIWSQLFPDNPAVPQNEIVANIDTGIWPEHPSFSDPDRWVSGIRLRLHLRAARASASSAAGRTRAPHSPATAS